MHLATIICIEAESSSPKLVEKLLKKVPDGGAMQVHVVFEKQTGGTHSTGALSNRPIYALRASLPDATSPSGTTAPCVVGSPIVTTKKYSSSNLTCPKKCLAGLSTLGVSGVVTHAIASLACQIDQHETSNSLLGQKNTSLQQDKHQMQKFEREIKEWKRKHKNSTTNFWDGQRILIHSYITHDHYGFQFATPFYTGSQRGGMDRFKKSQRTTIQYFEEKLKKMKEKILNATGKIGTFTPSVLNKKSKSKKISSSKMKDKDALIKTVEARYAALDCVLRKVTRSGRKDVLMFEFHIFVQIKFASSYAREDVQYYCQQDSRYQKYRKARNFHLMRLREQQLDDTFVKPNCKSNQTKRQLFVEILNMLRLSTYIYTLQDKGEEPAARCRTSLKPSDGRINTHVLDLKSEHLLYCDVRSLSLLLLLFLLLSFTISF